MNVAIVCFAIVQTAAWPYSSVGVAGLIFASALVGGRSSSASSATTIGRWPEAAFPVNIVGSAAAAIPIATTCFHSGASASSLFSGLAGSLPLRPLRGGDPPYYGDMRAIGSDQYCHSPLGVGGRGRCMEGDPVRPLRGGLDPTHSRGSAWTRSSESLVGEGRLFSRGSPPLARGRVSLWPH
eukprot:scaffold1475_cov147-Isochrysis_galbana.AAC.3